MNAFAVTGYAPQRRIALLIDADNVVHDKLAAMLEALARHGTAHIRRAYGDWGSDTLQKGWKEKLHECAIRPIQQFSYTPRKNATDIALVIDALELLYTQKPDAFCLVSSDADFTPLAMHLRAHGLEVYGFGARKAAISPKALGVKNFPALFEAIGLFEIFESATGEKYVADKRNEMRAAQPAGVIAAAR